MAVKNRCVRGSLAGSTVCAVEAYFHSVSGLYTRNIDIFIAPSEFLKSKYIEMGFPGEKIRVLPNFAIPEPALPDKKDENYVLFMGRLHPTKGAILLLDALSHVEDKNMRLVMAGTGEDEPLLRQRAASLSLPVTFAGFKTGTELEALVSGARFGIVPSIWYENCPMVIIEFWQKGIPVIASDWGGLSEMVDHEKNGLLFEPGSTESLAMAMNNLWDNPQLRKNMGAAGRQKAIDVYGPDNHFKGLMKIYEEAIKSCGRKSS